MKSHKPFLILFFLAIIIILSVTVSAARLPTIGGDDDAWGTVLNNYLNVSLNESGELRNNTVSTLQIVDGTITNADISDTTNLNLGEKITFTLGEIIDNIVDGWITITGSLNVTQNLNIVGNATIEGKLNVTGNVSANWFKGNLNWSEVQNAPEFMENNTEGWNLTFINIKSDDWTNVTITESQISDLQSYVSNGSNLNVLDINASSATIHGNFNVTGTSYLGDITIASDNITTNNIISKDGNISFYNGSGSEQVRITQDGEVGIGTSNPSTKLEVVGDIVSKGTSWTSQNSAADNNWRDVVYGNGRFVAVADTGTNDMVMTSPDGINWTNRASSVASLGITYNNGIFVAVGDNTVITSPDGITWTSRTSAADSGWWDIAYGNGLFVAVARTGTTRVMTSPDGITWTKRSSASQNNWVSITYGNGLFVAVSDVKQAASVDYGVMTSPDGITWTNQTVASLTYGGVTYGNGLFVAVANSGTGNRVVTSPDGITWTNRTTPVDNDWMGITYGNGLFVAVAETGTGDGVMTSPDGINWITRTSGADNTWEDVAYGNGVFVAVADSGTGDRVMISGKTEFNEMSHNNIYLGGIELRGDLNVTGTSYLGDITIASDNITTNNIIPKDGGNITIDGNLTIADKIIFTLGEIIDNIVDGWITVTGSLNVTENLNVVGNITGDWATLSNLNVTGTSYLGTMNFAGGNITATLGTFTTLNVTGTSYLGDISIASDNITTNNIISKDGNISFYNNTGGRNMRITNDGEIGIGISDPLATLHVQGPDINIPLAETLNTLSFYVGSGSGAGVGIGYNSSSHSYIQSYGSKPLTLNGAGNNVGIGTTTPSQKLTVVGNANITGNVTIGGNLSVMDGIKVGGAGTFLKNIQTGTIGDCTAANAGSSGQVTFLDSFSSVPIIMLTPDESGDENGCTSVRVTARTTTTFDWSSWIGGTATACDCIHWMAIEN